MRERKRLEEVEALRLIKPCFSGGLFVCSVGERKKLHDGEKSCSRLSYDLVALCVCVYAVV